MKKIIALLVVVAVVWIAWNRERLFLRDPLAHVTRNGVEEAGAQVYINYTNDVFLENDNPPLYFTLVEAAEPGGRIGTPKDPACMHWVVCLMDAYPATLVNFAPGARVRSMDGKEVRYVDTQGHEVAITLR